MALCARSAYQTGYRQSTIDSILWRACADRYLDSDTYVTEGWKAATERLTEELRLIDKGARVDVLEPAAGIADESVISTPANPEG